MDMYRFNEHLLSTSIVSGDAPSCIGLKRHHLLQAWDLLLILLTPLVCAKIIAESMNLLFTHCNLLMLFLLSLNLLYPRNARSFMYSQKLRSLTCRSKMFISNINIFFWHYSKDFGKGKCSVSEGFGDLKGAQNIRRYFCSAPFAITILHKVK